MYRTIYKYLFRMIVALLICAVPMQVLASTTVIYILSSGSFIWPNDWVSGTVEVIGGGGAGTQILGGACLSSGSTGGGGGAGGAYAILTAPSLQILTPGQVIPVTVTAAGASFSGNFAEVMFFGSSTLYAPGGQDGQSTLGGATTSTAVPVGDFVFYGGNGGNGGSPGSSGGGGGGAGGGAGGPHGNGAKGANGSNGASTSGGAGGAGGNADLTFGGTGGGSGAAGSGAASPGNPGQEYITAGLGKVGSGGGGGGGGGGNNGGASGAGATGGIYGGGGGGTGSCGKAGTGTATPGSETQGIIIITYTATKTSRIQLFRGYKLKIIHGVVKVFQK